MFQAGGDVIPCHNCHAVKSSMKELMRCSRCKKVNYCNAECQKAHWKVHKKLCKPPVVRPDGEINAIIVKPDRWETKEELRQLIQPISITHFMGDPEVEQRELDDVTGWPNSGYWNSYQKFYSQEDCQWYYQAYSQKKPSKQLPVNFTADACNGAVMPSTDFQSRGDILLCKGGPSDAETDYGIDVEAFLDACVYNRTNDAQALYQSMEERYFTGKNQAAGGAM